MTEDPSSSGKLPSDSSAILSASSGSRAGDPTVEVTPRPIGSGGDSGLFEHADEESTLRGDPLAANQLINGRYEIRGRIGKGGFGRVYLAFDHSLKRQVAIKQAAGLHSFVDGHVRDEARAVASLNHPNIIQIHDLIEVTAREWLIVMELLDGIPLSRRIRQSRIPIIDAVRIAADVTAALVHANERRLVHSDLKPANLFLCADGVVKLLDFGLAVVNFPDDPVSRIGGTPGYMSPEQIRGESHLIDGRADIWALGVVLYEMLTGARAFSVDKRQQHRTLLQTATPPRQLNAGIDDELQRIVMKCMQPLIGLRYDSAVELQQDILPWLEAHGAHSANTLSADFVASGDRGPESISSNSIRIGKRGLQPFTELDASSYLPLIPGPRDRRGVPDSIRFWKRWVESDDPATEYPVGVLHGPSGSGKTSYVRAGLFKQLGGDICRVYVECRPGDLASRLSRIVESRLLSGVSGSSLREVLMQFRSDDSAPHGFQKLLIVLDQFESWAHTASLQQRLEFAEALRQCDGIQIRALVVTRDEYWSGAKELLRWLDMPMQEGRNVASIELIDRAHAANIMESMGREARILPSDGEPLTSQQQQFIGNAIDELAVSGGVICVHLVMFLQMVRLQQWTPRALRASGGVAGACSLFFQELFAESGRHSPDYHHSAPAVRTILTNLVPADDVSVSDVNVSLADLKEVVSQQGHSHLFDDALRILTEDLRIVAVVSFQLPEDLADLQGVATKTRARENATVSVDERDRLQLAHNFLVEPVNAFLSRSLGKSWRGRAQTRLSEWSQTWSRRQTGAFLPGFVEYMSLVAGSIFSRHTAAESRFLKAAARKHAGRISIAVVALVAFFSMSLVAWYQHGAAADATHRELMRTADLMFHCSPSDLIARMEQLRGFGSDARSEISVWRDSDDPNVRLRSELFLQSMEPESLSDIASNLGDAQPEFFPLILGIAGQASDSLAALRKQVSDGGEVIKANRAAILLAYLGDESVMLSRLAGSDDADFDQALVREAITWRGDPKLWADLVNDDSHDPQIRYHAATIVATYSSRELADAAVSFDFAMLINSPRATIHSIGRFLARHMGENVWQVPLVPNDSANWRIGPDGIPMVRIEPTSFEHLSKGSDPSLDRTIEVETESPFWMAAVPVSRRLYAEFVASDSELPDGSTLEITYSRRPIPDYLMQDPNQPIYGTSLAQAFTFCNWLSLRENRQPCYRFTEKQTQPIELGQRGRLSAIPWTRDKDANGYRLPTIAEFGVVAYAQYERGIAWKNARKIAGLHGFPVEPEFAFPVMQVIPSRLGLFVYDDRCGCWVSDSNYVASQFVVEAGIKSGTLITPKVLPGEAIFLALNGETAP